MIQRLAAIPISGTLVPPEDFVHRSLEAVSSIPALFAGAMTLSGEEPKPVLQRFFSEAKGKSVSSRFTCHLICELL